MDRSYEARWRAAVADELAAEATATRPVLPAAHLAGLPDPVRRYVEASGAVGKPVPRNMRLEFDAVMWRRPGGSRMPARSVQLNGFGRLSRLFVMRARMFGLPVQGLHLYREERATFQVRAAGLVTMVDEAGDAISRAETVTLLNDLCVFAPATLADPRLTWRPVDDRTAAVELENGPYRVAATVRFNERDELVDFWSDDRPEGGIGAGSQPSRWRTPISAYRVIDGRRLPTVATAIYERPEGPFTYGAFTLRSIAYDVSAA